MRVALISHCNLLGNSAMHVFSMAEGLQDIGHDVVMLVPDSAEEAESHRKSTFPVILYEDALTTGLPFKENGKRADVIHAWTPREHVRNITTALSQREDCPYVLHMEDNEEKIVTDELKNIDFDELSNLPDIYQDLLASPYRAHPRKYREFVAGALGYTCLIDRLLEFKPKDTNGLVFWPGFDPEFETLPTNLTTIREKYGLSTDETIVLYSGNVHQSINNDVRNLYLAICFLRGRGHNIRLLRTGWNYAKLDIPTDIIAQSAVVELGFVERSAVPELVAIADVLVQPGKSDAFNDYRFPSKLPEYLVSGRSVILPDSNIGRFLIEDTHAIKLYKGTLQELICSIERLIKSPDLRKRLGIAARKFALENLRWSNSARCVSEFYENILKNDYKARPIELGVPAAEKREHPVKLIGFYLPQFHPIEENNRWWGKGFTEWTNVARARPYMFGQRHPRLPTELGYYDLRVIDNMHEQTKLAESYGLGGFCFYVYWFEGRRLLERPLELWQEKGPNFPYCICWANENWSRRWDGSESDILISQDYAEGFEERFIIDMLPILKDPRYIKVNGAPLLAIYRISELPDPQASSIAFRRAAAKWGIPEIHLVMIQSFGLSDPRPFGCDAAVEFSPPHTNRLLVDPKLVGGTYSEFAGHVEDYVGVAAQSINARPTNYVRYRGCFPMWDNTARRGSRGHVFINESPKAYGHWLRFLVHEALTRRERVEPLIFINAWNEWAEGTYLEPDEHYGRALLEVTHAALIHGVADFALGGASPVRNREFSYTVSRLPKM